MIKVWGRKTSSNVQVVMWCIAELGLQCERIDAGLTYGVTDTPEYLAMNPNGTVPTLVDGDNGPLWESAAIVRYLAETYAADPFWPADAIARARVDQWAEWAKINVSMNFSVPVFWRVVRTPKANRDPAAITAAMANLEQYLALADRQLAAQPFLTGASLTAADIQFGHLLFRYFDIDVARANLPNLARYYRALTERAHYREHVMINYDELRQN